MTARTLWSGGQATARRTVVVVAMGLSGIAAPPSEAGQAGARPEVAVTEHDGLYSVTARFQVRQPKATALAVLTDYEQIPRFMPGVVTSVVRQREPGHAVVEQEAVPRMWMFSKRIHLLLEVHEHADALRFHDASGRSFSRYEGAWRFAEADGVTEITYELTAKPAFSVPDFVLKRLLKRDAVAMIERLQAEMALRERMPTPPQATSVHWPAPR